MKETTITHLMSEAGERLSSNPFAWKQYPRPQLRRDVWQNLNDGWTIEETPVRVPFPPESLLSGICKEQPDTYCYNLSFSVSGALRGDGRLLLHFGAVDQICEVTLNGKTLGSHIGGYLPFSFDITDVVKDGINKLCVFVTDTLDLDLPYGKQCKKRGGMWYTPVSGIWQSVWLERVPDIHITGLKITPSMNNVTISVSHSETTLSPCISFTDDAGRFHCEEGDCVTFSFENPRLWSPSDPYLYEFEVSLGNDVVKSYFALREFGFMEVGSKRVLALNRKPIFLQGVLDQGYFSDGIFTPAEEEEYLRDIQRMKELGMNMLRKHIKIEPECFYYYCDKYGMLVFQDMVNNGSYSYFWETALPAVGIHYRNDRMRFTNEKRKAYFRQMMIETLEHLYNHPCIVGYTIFNEGWGQYNSDEMYALAKSLDSTRVYDATSGWFPQKDNEFDSRHVYFDWQHFPKKPKKPLFLSECGGASYIEEGHIANPDNNYGYGGGNTKEALREAIDHIYDTVIFASIPVGCVGYVYTQVSDVEDETNGFYTYDRKVCKVDKKQLRALTKKADELFHKNLEH